MNILPWLPSGDSRAKNLRAIILSSLGLFLKLFAENQMMLNTKFIAISLSLYCYCPLSQEGYFHVKYFSVSANYLSLNTTLVSFHVKVKYPQ